MQNPKPEFNIIQMPPINTNSVLVCVGDKCVIFDVWGRDGDWVRTINERGLNLCAIYSTHGHPDHISAAPALSARFNVPWFLDVGDFNLVGWGNDLLDYFGLPHIAPDLPKPTQMPSGRTEILPGVIMEIIPSPGHTCGSVMFWFPDYKILLSGDTIFADNIGRSDLPGGNRWQLMDSIGGLYKMNLPDDTIVVSGHGINTTIKKLKLDNPWFRAR